MATQQYHALPHTFDDMDRDSSSHEHLLPTMTSNIRRVPSSCAITIYPVLALRLISTILGLTSFIIFIIDGGAPFVAATIFLALLLIFNTIMIIHHSVSHIFKVTIELRRNEWRNELGRSQRKPKLSLYVDILLVASLSLSLIIGNGVKNNYWGGAWKGAVVVGWFVVCVTQKTYSQTANTDDNLDSSSPSL
jgi:hypothetical protein